VHERHARRRTHHADLLTAVTSAERAVVHAGRGLPYVNDKWAWAIVHPHRTQTIVVELDPSEVRLGASARAAASCRAELSSLYLHSMDGYVRQMDLTCRMPLVGVFQVPLLLISAVPRP
jgi:hypothetical protein